ncbi:Integral membrane protein, partial [Neofusicoccum parvum]
MAGWFERDTSWRWALIPFWSQVETTLGIICACIPTFNPLIKLALKRLGLRSSRGSSRTTTTSSVRATTTQQHPRRRTSRIPDPDPGIGLEPSYPFRTPLDPDDDEFQQEYFQRTCRSSRTTPSSTRSSQRYPRSPPRLGFVHAAPPPSPTPTLVGTGVRDFGAAREGGVLGAPSARRGSWG